MAVRIKEFMYSEKDIARFNAFYDKTGSNECWHWKGNINSWGYGMFKHGGRKHNAHRVAFEIAHNVDLGQLVCRHLCNCADCVNPAHLISGTQRDNVSDTIRMKRHGRQRLTIQDVLYIKAHPEIRTKDLASSFNVGANTISMIRSGKNWQNV